MSSIIMFLIWIISFIVMMIGFHKIMMSIIYTSRLGVFLLIIGALGYAGIPIYVLVLGVLAVLGRS